MKNSEKIKHFASVLGISVTSVRRRIALRNLDIDEATLDDIRENLKTGAKKKTPEEKKRRKIARLQKEVAELIASLQGEKA